MPTSFAGGHFLHISVFMRQLILLCLFLQGGGTFAQTPEFDWIARFQQSGNLMGTGALTDLVVSDDGTTYLLSSFYSTMDVNPRLAVLEFNTNGGSDVAIIKLNKYGKLIWARQVGGPDYDFAFKVRELPNDDIMVTGIFKDSMDLDPGSGVDLRYSNGGYDGFAVRITSSGDYVQGKTIGGTGFDALYDMDFDENDQIWISGRIEDSVDLNPEGVPTYLFAPNGAGGFIAKVDDNFQLDPIISMNAGESCGIFDFEISQNGELHYVCYFSDTLHASFADTSFQKISNGSMDVLYGITELSGNEFEHIHFGGELKETAYSLVELKHNKFALLAAYADSLKFQLNGTDIYIPGNNDGPGNFGHFRNTAVLKFDGVELEWIKTVNTQGSGTYSQCYSFGDFGVDDQDNIYLGLIAKGSCGVNQNNMNTFGSVNTSGSVVARLNSDGVFTGIYAFTGEGDIEINTLKIYGGDLYLGANQYGVIDLNFTEATKDAYVVGNSIAKYDLQNPTLFTEMIDPNTPLIYPNPANELLNVPTLDAQNLRVFDLSGREIPVEHESNGEATKINTSALSEGSYFVRYAINGEFVSQRFVVQH